MTSVCREIFKAIHEGKWLSIEYKNQTGKRIEEICDEKLTEYYLR